MPHAKSTSDGTRPTTSDGGSSSSNTGFGGLKSKFREFGSSASHLAHRSNSGSRKNSTAPVAPLSPITTSKPLLPSINIDEFMPHLGRARATEHMRRICADLRVQIQILEKQQSNIAAALAETRAKIRTIHLEKSEGLQVSASRAAATSARYDMWSKRLSRRRPEHAQIFSTRTARRPPSERDISEEDDEDDDDDEPSSIYSAPDSTPLEAQ